MTTKQSEATVKATVDKVGAVKHTVVNMVKDTKNPEKDFPKLRNVFRVC